VPGALYVPVVIAALAPMMLPIAGEQADGTFTWMTGPHTVESHVVPRMNRAADSADRPSPRICVGMPLAVTDNPQEARAQAAKTYGRYGQLTNCWTSKAWKARRRLLSSATKTRLQSS